MRDSEQRFFSHKHLTSQNIFINGLGKGDGELKVWLADIESD
jgi:hypothetical protein